MSAIQQMLLAGGVAANSYATWSPTDKSSSIALSGGDLTVSFAGGGASDGICRATVSKTTGKWYWETTIIAVNTSTLIGIATSSASLGGYIYDGIYGIAFYPIDGKLYGISGSTGGAVTATAGAVVGTLLDLVGGTVGFTVNGTLSASGGILSYASGMSSAIFPAIRTYPNSGGSYRNNFGASPFAYTPPAGYNAGLYL